jgi:hypothetical protein
MRSGGGAVSLVVWLAASIETPSETAASAPKARAANQILILTATFSFRSVAWASVRECHPKRSSQRVAVPALHQRDQNASKAAGSWR